MDTKYYISLIDSQQRAYKRAQKQEDSVECVMDLFDAIYDISDMVYNMTYDEKEQTKNSILKRMQKINNEDNKHYALLRTALAYLEFFSYCPIDYLLKSGLDGKKIVMLDMFSASDWNKLLSGFNPTILPYVKQVIISKEMKLYYKKVLEKTGIGYICLNAYNKNSLSDMLLPFQELRAKITGPISIKENNNLPYTEQNKITDGYLTDTLSGNEKTYTTQFYAKLYENCKKSIEFNQHLIEIYKQIESQKTFKGLFSV
ncbi:MAG: hypothetical protein IJA69_00745, partial [Clostridia bacterium]|nr:hypothetical protein [Clostridia bacterium]